MGHANPSYLAVIEGDLHALHLPAAAAVSVALELVRAVVQRDLLVVGLMVKKGSKSVRCMRVYEFSAYRRRQAHTHENVPGG
jgi:hypothetical protein